MKTFGERLKELRSEYKITLEKLAEILNTTKATLSHYENNHRTPKVDFATKVANYFNVDTDYILGESDTRRAKNIQNTYPTKLFKDNLPQDLQEAGFEYIELFEHAKKSGLTHEDIKAALEFAEKMKKKG